MFEGPVMISAKAPRLPVDVAWSDLVQAFDF